MTPSIIEIQSLHYDRMDSSFQNTGSSMCYTAACSSGVKGRPLIWKALHRGGCLATSQKKRSDNWFRQYTPDSVIDRRVCGLFT